MVHTLVRIKFADYATWKTVFDEFANLRRAYGSKGVRVFRLVDNPNEALIIGEYEHIEKARQLFQSPEFLAAAQRAGVLGPPEVEFLNEVDQLPA